MVLIIIGIDSVIDEGNMTSEITKLWPIIEIVEDDVTCYCHYDTMKNSRSDDDDDGIDIDDDDTFHGGVVEADYLEHSASCCYLPGAHLLPALPTPHACPSLLPWWFDCLLLMRRCCCWWYVDWWLLRWLQYGEYYYCVPLMYYWWYQLLIVTVVMPLLMMTIELCCYWNDEDGRRNYEGMTHYNYCYWWLTVGTLLLTAVVVCQWLFWNCIDDILTDDHWHYWLPLLTRLIVVIVIGNLVTENDLHWWWLVLTVIDNWRVLKGHWYSIENDPHWYLWLLWWYWQ